MQHEDANLAVFLAGLVQDAGQFSTLCGAFLFVQWAKGLLLIGSGAAGLIRKRRW
jgi:hypothetical protein